MTIVEKTNKLIAHFMHPEMLDKGKIEKEGVENSGNMMAKMAIFSDDYRLLNYHKSWNQLMPVIEKIQSLGYEVAITNNQCSIEDNEGIIAGRESLNTYNDLIMCVYETVADFIRQY